jgi:hypothetical protein
VILIFLEESDDICLSASLDKMLICATLRIIDFHIGLGLNLAHQVKLLQLSHINLLLAMLVLMHHTKKVVFVSLVVKNWTVVHIVLKDCDTLSRTVNLTK